MSDDGTIVHVLTPYECTDIRANVRPSAKEVQLQHPNDQKRPSNRVLMPTPTLNPVRLAPHT